MLVVIAVRTYKPVIDNEKCDACAVCIRGCPAEIIPAQRKEEKSLRGCIYQGNRVDIKVTPLLNADKSFDWPPCQRACPIHQDIRGYIKLVGKGKYEEALKLIRETNALPSVTGYICPHPCERACVRKLVDQPVSIRALKRFVADFDDGKLTPQRVKGNGKRVSIIGSGPAGLTAAFNLAKAGYQVEIIEARSEGGGILRWAIPPSKLPNNILNRDIKFIERMGVKIKTGIGFGKDVTLAGLKKEGVHAIIIAIGRQPNLLWNQEKIPLNFSPKSTFIVDDSYMTNINGIFAAGMIVHGPITLVDAMASGKRAAKAVDIYLSQKGQRS